MYESLCQENNDNCIFRLDIDVPDEEEDEDAIIEKRRKERQALMQVTIKIFYYGNGKIGKW